MGIRAEHNDVLFIPQYTVISTTGKISLNVFLLFIVLLFFYRYYVESVVCLDVIQLHTVNGALNVLM